MNLSFAIEALQKNTDALKEITAFQHHYAAVVTAAIHVVEVRNEGPLLADELDKAIRELAKVLETPCASSGSPTSTSTS